VVIVDAHAHVFPEVRGHCADGPTRGLGYGCVARGDEPALLVPGCGEATAHAAGTLLAEMDWAGVDRAILLQGPFYGECNEYVLRAVGQFPTRLAGAAYVDPWQSNGRQTTLETLVLPGFCAAKIEFSVSAGLCAMYPGARLDDPQVAWLWEYLQRRGLVLVLDLGSVGSRSYQTDAVRAIAQRHPALRIVVAHLAKPTPVAEADPRLWALWQEQIDLGRLPNVWFDTASVVAYAFEEDYPFPTAERYLRLALERIGAEKVLWGTDTPALTLTATYRQLVQLGQRHTQFLSKRDQALVMGGNAMRVFGIGG
jgi:predicted TIM-barrel fold metal-dependent hydrolase